MPDPQLDGHIEDKGWDSEPPDEVEQTDWPIKEIGPDHRAVRRSGSRLRGAALIAVAALGLIGILLGLIAARRYDELTARIQQDVLASHTLMRRAAAQADAELFNMLLPDDDSGWSAAQHELLSRGLIDSRAAFGLIAPPVEPTIRVTPTGDLQEAEVSSEQTYTVRLGHGVTQTIRLRHTAFYRLEGQRWLLSRPDIEFWGDLITTTGRVVTLIYPTRDQDIGSRLARDLDAVFSPICAEFDEILCPASRPLRIRMATEASYLIHLLDTTDAGITYYDDALGFVLPSPTLFGTPLDEAGYQVMYRRYAMRIADPLLRFAPGLQAHRSLRWFFVSAAHRMLAQHGLRAWPPIEVDEPPPSSAPGSPPEQDIALYCVESPRTGGSLYRYAPSSGTWTKELSDRIFLAMTPLSGGLVLREQSILAGEAPPRLILWREGHEQLLLESPDRSMSIDFTGQADPLGQQLVVRLGIVRPNFAILDLNRCGSSGCTWSVRPNLPIWSPDGSHTLMQARSDATLLLGDREARTLTEIGDGISPFWLNDSTYGYLVFEQFGPLSEIVTAAITDSTPHSLLKLDDLMKDRPDAGQGSYALWYYPPDPRWLLIEVIAFGGGGDGSDFFLLNLRSRDVSRLPLDGKIAHHEFSPGGRWLAVATLAPNNAGWSLHVFDVEKQTEPLTSDSMSASPPFPFPFLDWSLDGQWLLSLNGGILYLFAPAYNYHRAIVPDSPGCAFATWIDPTRSAPLGAGSSQCLAAHRRRVELPICP